MIYNFFQVVDVEIYTDQKTSSFEHIGPCHYEYTENVP